LEGGLGRFSTASKRLATTPKAVSQLELSHHVKRGRRKPLLVG
jgi:hypothetical protein